MQAAACTHCHTRVGCEQHACPACNARLGFVPELGILCAFEDRGEAGWHPLGVPGVGVRLPCGNYGEYPICHWTVPAEGSDCFCESCRCLACSPRLAEPLQRQRWARFGRARRQLFIGLRRLGLLDAQGQLRGLPGQLLFDVDDETHDGAGQGLVRTDGHGPIRVNLHRLDEQSDRALFDELRRAVGRRLGLALRTVPPAQRSGGPIFDADCAIAQWDARWARLAADAIWPAQRPTTSAGHETGGSGLFA